MDIEGSVVLELYDYDQALEWSCRRPIRSQMRRR